MASALVPLGPGMLGCGTKFGFYLRPEPPGRARPS